MTADVQPGKARLTGANAARSDVDQPWEQDNQAWWDWYVSLGAEEIDSNQGGRSDDHSSVDRALSAELQRSDVATDDELDIELSTPYPLEEAQRRFFRRNGYIKLPQVLSRPAVRRLRLDMTACFVAEFGLDPDLDAVDRFLSVEMAWVANRSIRRFVLSPRIARLSAELLEVCAVRLYHDNLLAKQPGCGRTPWHYDQHHFPLATDDIVTAWIPAQSIAPCMGPLTFAGPIDAHRHVEHIEFDKFGTSYDRRVDEAFRCDPDRIRIEDGGFAMGEVSFHHNLCFHSAGPNRTRFSRMALANTYFVDGARVVDHPTMVSGDWQKFLPGVEPGALADSRLNPICWSKNTASPDRLP
jgi:hypothetical protein